MKKPEWLYSWTWTEADELRLSGAASDLEKVANEISSIAATCANEGKSSLSYELITDAGTHYEDELALWKQKIDSDVVSNLTAAASAIRSTVAERQTIWDQFQREMKTFNEWLEEQKDKVVEQFD